MKKRARRPPAKMTTEIAATAWAIWQKTPVVDELVRQLKLSRPTCDRLVNEGYPTLGIEPLRDRLININKKAAENADLTLTKIKTDMIKSLWNVTQVLKTALNAEAVELKKLQRQPGYDGSQLPPKLREMAFNEMTKELVTVYKALMLAAGGPDGRLELTGERAAVEGFLEMSRGWSEAQLREYVKKVAEEGEG